MARQPRVEFEGAFHHVMSRGNDGIAIFRDDHDRQLFLDLLGEEISRSRWIVHDYCLMGNHYHLSITTPECTLSTGMHRLLSRYAQRFNKRHGRRGHLFEQRFKNVLVEEETHGLVLTRYIALNPVRAGLCERPEQWAWSSYGAHAGLISPPSWLATEPLMRQFGSEVAVRQGLYREFVLAGIGLDDRIVDEAQAGLFLGSPAWIDRVQGVLDRIELSEEYPREQVHLGRPDLDSVIEAVAQTFDTTGEAVCAGRGSLERRLVAYFAFEEGLVTLRQIAKRLHLRSPARVSCLVSECRSQLREDEAIRELAQTCRSRMRRRPPPFLLPTDGPPPGARRYHRAPARSQR